MWIKPGGNRLTEKQENNFKQESFIVEGHSFAWSTSGQSSGAKRNPFREFMFSPSQGAHVVSLISLMLIGELQIFTNESLLKLLWTECLCHSHIHSNRAQGVNQFLRVKFPGKRTQPTGKGTSHWLHFLSHPARQEAAGRLELGRESSQRPSHTGMLMLGLETPKL